MNPFTSIIIPCFNVAERLPDCINSILDQSFSNFEVICVDNASTDNTMDILKSFAAKDARVIVAREEKKGPAYARNKGLSVARGEYCWFVDGRDSLYDKAALSHLVEVAKRYDADVARGNHILYSEDDKKYIRETIMGVKIFLTKSCNSLWAEVPELWAPWFLACFLINRKLLIDNQIKYPDLLRGEVPPFLLRVFLAAYRVACTSEIIYRYHFSSETMKRFKWSAKSCEDFLYHVIDVKSLLMEHGYTPQWRLYGALAASKLPSILPIALESGTTRHAELIVSIFSDLWQMRDVSSGPYSVNTDWGEVFVSLVACEAKIRKATTAKDFRFLEAPLNLDDPRKIRLSKNRDACVWPGYSQTPLLSVVVPVYGTEKYLLVCLDSIISQSLKNIEIIVVNDCSPDNSERIIKDFHQKDNRIKYIKHKSNLGLGGARNTGISAASGKYIGSVDSDDFIDPITFETAVTRCELDRTDVAVFSGVDYIDGSGELVPRELYDLSHLSAVHQITTENIGALYVSFPLKVYRRAFLEQIGVTFSNHLFHEDDEYYWKLFGSALPRISVIPEKFYYRRKREDSSSIMDNTRNSRKDVSGILLEIMRFFKKKGTFEKLRSAYVDRAARSTYLVAYVSQQHRERVFHEMQTVFLELKPERQEIVNDSVFEEIEIIRHSDFATYLSWKMEKIDRAYRGLKARCAAEK